MADLMINLVPGVTLLTELAATSALAAIYTTTKTKPNGRGLRIILLKHL